MEKIRQWVDRLSVKKKLIFYGYLIITPVLLLICIVLLFYNYNKELNGRLENDIASVNTLSDSINMLQSDIKDFSTYICINTEVHNLLNGNEVEEKNKNSKLWNEEAPMQIVQDMISLKGHIQTIAIYPENGIRPYLRGMDGSVYIPDIDTVHETEIYKETIESSNGMIWRSVPKGRGETYETNRTDKVVLYREIFDLTQKKTLGYIVIGVSQKKFMDMCENVIQGDGESILILDKNGGELCQSGTLDEKVEQYLKSDEFLKMDYRKRKIHFSYKDYDVICKQSEANASIV